MTYDHRRKKTEIGPTKRNKIRTVDFGEKLTEILKAALQEQQDNRKKYGDLYKQNYCLKVKEKNRDHYELYSEEIGEQLPQGHISFDLVCTREDGRFVRTQQVDYICHKLSKEI